MIKYRYTLENQSIETLDLETIPNGVDYETIDFDPNYVEDVNSKIALHVFYPEYTHMDYKLLQLDNLYGIKRLEPISDKGLKGEKKYTKDDVLIWSITSKFWFELDSTYPDGIIKTAKLYNIGGEVVDSWDKKVELSIDDKETIRKEQRQRILSYLKSQQPDLYSFLYYFFKSEITDYMELGNKSAFEAVLTDASLNHESMQVRGTLTMEIPTQSGGTTTVLQGILYELV